MTRLRDIVAPYGLFFVDQFGVLRDGKGAYPGAIETLKALHAPGRTVVILSNSGKRSSVNEQRLVDLGFPRDSFDLFLTSGEVVYQMFADGRLPRPKACFVLSRNNDTSPIDGLGIGVTDDPEQADLVLIAGSEAPSLTLSDYRRRLQPFAARRIPAICANPDMTMLVPSGTAFGSGVIGRLYKELGGTVTWIGKPYGAIYETARAMTGLKDVRALGIGDSVEHDVVGAKNAGADAAMILAGIHAGTGDLNDEYRKHRVRPDYVLDRFAW